MKKRYQFNLTPLVLDYQDGRADAESVLEQCSLFVFRRIRRHPLLNDDTRQDFYISFLPYLKRMIREFDYQGVPFERYICMIMRHRIKSFYRSSRRQWFYWCISGDASLAPAYLPEESLPHPAHERLAEIIGTGPDGRLAEPAARKWFLVWILKHTRTLEAADIALCARLTGFDEAEISSMAERLRAGLVSQEQRLENLRSRRNRLFLRARILEMRLQQELDEGLKEKCAGELRRRRSSLRNVMRLISRIGFQPPHRLIAEVTGIPKGSIDTIAARLKQILEAATARLEIHSA